MKWLQLSSLTGELFTLYFENVWNTCVYLTMKRGRFFSILKFLAKFLWLGLGLSQFGLVLICNARVFFPVNFVVRCSGLGCDFVFKSMVLTYRTEFRTIVWDFQAHFPVNTFWPIQTALMSVPTHHPRLFARSTLLCAGEERERRKNQV